jgi:putative tryptophan/tyrosine transport system substrate-binding protein
LGWSEGRNVRINIRWATANADELRRHAAELAALAPDVILAATGTATTAPLLQAAWPGNGWNCSSRSRRA